MSRTRLFSTALLAYAAFFAASAQANDYVLTLKEHQFSPNRLTVPAGQKIKLLLKNEQSSPAEFESTDLHREKVVGANSEATVNLGPLKAGEYRYFDDFHREATGVITTK